jgi:hypothetical protein
LIEGCREVLAPQAVPRSVFAGIINLINGLRDPPAATVSV